MSSNPASMICWRSSCNTLAVTAITFTPDSPASARMRRVASRPSITGIRTSISTRSAGSCRNDSSASSPLPASSRRNPAERSILARMWRLV